MTFDPKARECTVNSPRSLEALRRDGILPSEIMAVDKGKYVKTLVDRGMSKPCAEERYAWAEEKRKRILNLAIETYNTLLHQGSGGAGDKSRKNNAAMAKAISIEKHRLREEEIIKKNLCSNQRVLDRKIESEISHQMRIKDSDDKDRAIAEAKQRAEELKRIENEAFAAKQKEQEKRRLENAAATQADRQRAQEDLKKKLNEGDKMNRAVARLRAQQMDAVAEFNRKHEDRFKQKQEYENHLNQKKIYETKQKIAKAEEVAENFKKEMSLRAKQNTDHMKNMEKAKEKFQVIQEEVQSKAAILDNKYKAKTAEAQDKTNRHILKKEIRRRLYTTAVKNPNQNIFEDMNKEYGKKLMEELIEEVKKEKEEDQQKRVKELEKIQQKIESREKNREEELVVGLRKNKKVRIVTDEEKEAKSTNKPTNLSRQQSFKKSSRAPDEDEPKVDNIPEEGSEVNYGKNQDNNDPATEEQPQLEIQTEEVGPGDQTAPPKPSSIPAFKVEQPQLQQKSAPRAQSKPPKQSNPTSEQKLQSAVTRLHPAPLAATHNLTVPKNYSANPYLLKKHIYLMSKLSSCNKKPVELTVGEYIEQLRQTHLLHMQAVLKEETLRQKDRQQSLAAVQDSIERRNLMKLHKAEEERATKRIGDLVLKQEREIERLRAMDQKKMYADGDEESDDNN